MGTTKQQIEEVIANSSLFDVIDALSDICIEMSVKKNTPVPDGIATGLRRLKQDAQVALYESGGEMKTL